jgi:hypothetical protein
MAPLDFEVGRSRSKPQESKRDDPSVRRATSVRPLLLGSSVTIAISKPTATNTKFAGEFHRYRHYLPSGDIRYIRYASVPWNVILIP